METNYRLTNPILHYGILLTIYVVGLLTLLSHTIFHAAHTHNFSQSLNNTKPLAAIASCSGRPAHSYHLRFTSKGIMPAQVVARLCDELTIFNDTSGEVMAALGPHEHHIHYPDFNETPLAQHQSYSFRLLEAGSFPLHDHDNESLRATITIRG